jgi:hypothetical protein
VGDAGADSVVVAGQDAMTFAVLRMLDTVSVNDAVIAMMNMFSPVICWICKHNSLDFRLFRSRLQAPKHNKQPGSPKKPETPHKTATRFSIYRLIG